MWLNKANLKDNLPNQPYLVCQNVLWNRPTTLAVDTLFYKHISNSFLLNELLNFLIANSLGTRRKMSLHIY